MNAALPEPLRTAVVIFFLTLFLDILDLSFARILWFAKTLRFWLFFILHFGLSCLAAYLLHDLISQWYLLGFFGTFLGVAVLSNSDIKIAGYSLLPVAQMFLQLKAKMLEQAADDKATAVARAQLVEGLQKLPVGELERLHGAALVAAGFAAQRVQALMEKANRRCRGEELCIKRALIAKLLRVNYEYARHAFEHNEQALAPQAPIQ